MLALLSVAREVGESAARRPWRAFEALPGPAANRGSSREHVRRTARTAFHPVGSCRMGTDDLAVVDPDLRARGVDALRVAGASIMPAIVTANTNTNTNTTVLAIAERAASLIQGQAMTADDKEDVNVNA